MQTNNKNLTLLITCITIFILVALGGILYFENLRTNGTTVILETEPVDPRSLMRGDYVILNYSISLVPRDQFAQFLKIIWDTKVRKIPVYTILELDQSNRVVSHTHTLEEPKNTLYISGFITKWVSDTEFFVRDMRIDYGIGQYFVPEWKGWTIERVGRAWWESIGEKLEVKISTYNGRSQIIDLLIDWEIVNFDTIESENPFVR